MSQERSTFPILNVISAIHLAITIHLGNTVFTSYSRQTSLHTLPSTPLHMITASSFSDKTYRSKTNVLQKKAEKGSFFKAQDSTSGFFSSVPISGNQFFQRKRNESLSPQLQANMETAFGHDFSGVAIQKNSQEAVSINARAFALGDSIHFAPGQFDQHTDRGKNLIGHEFTHVVQQRNGVVSPTTKLGKGTLANDNKALESEADHMGAKAVKGEIIQKYNSAGATSAQNMVIQRAVTTSGGTFDADKYDLRRNKDSSGRATAAAHGVRGLDIILKFTPNTTVDADKIGLTQTAQSVVGTTHPFVDTNVNAQKRAIMTGAEKGTKIDRVDGKNNPIYGSDRLAVGDGLDKTPINNKTGPDARKWGENITYELGFRHQIAGVWKTQKAKLSDSPTLVGAQNNSKQIFETTAVAVKGTQAGTYYGSVKWGWQTDGRGTFTKVPFTVISQGVPSSTFMKTAKLWNAAKDTTGADTADLPIAATKAVKGSSVVLMQLIPRPNLVLPIGTRVQIITKSFSPWLPPFMYSEVKVINGPNAGHQGKVNGADWSNLANE